MAGRISGKVTTIDATGNLVTDLRREQLRGVESPHKLTVSCNGFSTCGIFDADHVEPDMTLLAIWNRAGLLELTLVGDNASEFLGIRLGAEVIVLW